MVVNWRPGPTFSVAAAAWLAHSSERAANEQSKARFFMRGPFESRAAVMSPDDARWQRLAVPRRRREASSRGSLAVGAGAGLCFDAASGELPVVSAVRSSAQE